MQSMFSGEAALYGQDPSLAALYRRRKFAEELIKSGTSAAPVSAPLEGVARLVQALTGTYEEAEADKGARAIGDEMKATREAGNAEFARLLTGGGGQPSPMAAALTGQTQQPGGTLKDRIHMAEAGGSMAPGIVGDGGNAGGPMQVWQAALTDVNRRLGTNYTFDQVKGDSKIGKMVGDTYVDILSEQTGGDDRQTAAAYNAGLGRVKAAVAAGGPNWEQHLPESTRNNYLPKVFGGQPQAAPAPQGPDPRLERVQALEAYAVRQSQSQDPRIQAQGRMAWEQSKTLAGQIEADRRRADEQGFRREQMGQARDFRLEDQRRDDVNKAQPPEAVFRNLTDKVTKGTATPAEEDEFFGAAANWTRTTVNPQTGEVIAGRDLAPRWFQALEALKARNASPNAAPVATEPGAEPRPLTDIGGVNVSKAGTTKEAPATVVTAALNNASALRKIMQAGKEIEKNPNAVGLQNAAMTGVIRDRVDPSGVDARAALADLASMVVNDRSGAAVSVAEFPRLKPFIPEPTDTPETIKKKLTKMEAEIRDILTDQYTTYGPKAGYRSLSAIDDVLKPKEGAKAAQTLPPQAAASLKEGAQTTFGNGQVWTLQGGNPVRVK